jgi:hypothetical protein
LVQLLLLQEETVYKAVAVAVAGTVVVPVVTQVAAAVVAQATSLLPWL